MDNVVAYRGTLGVTKRVHTPHVTQLSPAKVVDVVVFNFVSYRRTVTISPNLATGDTGIAEIGNIVVGDFIITAVEDNDTYSRGENVPAMLS